MSMKCHTCQVAMNSLGQYQQHLQGKTHAKKLKQAEDGGQPQGPPPGQGQKQQGRGRGRPIVGGGGRGGGSQTRGGKRGNRGRGGPINFVRAQGSQPQGFGQSAAQQGQVMSGLDPTVLNALHVPANTGSLQSQNFGRQQQPFGNNQPAFGGSQPQYGNSQPAFGNSQPAFGNSQPAFGNNKFAFGNGRSGFGNSQSQQFSPQQNQRFVKPRMPKQLQPPPPPPPPEEPSSNEPLVFGDHMGMVSVSMEGNDPLYCQICYVKLNSAEQADFHYRGTKHIKKARVARMHEVGALTEDTEGAEPGFFFCGFCNITVNSAEQMTAHREGTKHKRFVEQRKRRTGEPMETEPVAKKASPDPTDSIPVVDASEILPFDKMFPVSSATST